jgi:hypothetical protein
MIRATLRVLAICSAMLSRSDSHCQLPRTRPSPTITRHRASSPRGTVISTTRKTRSGV